MRIYKLLCHYSVDKRHCFIHCGKSCGNSLPCVLYHFRAIAIPVPSRFSLSYLNFYRICSFHAPDGKVHGASMGPIWGRQDPGRPHELGLNIFIYAQSGSSLQKLWCSINFALWVLLFSTHPHIDGQVQACSNSSALVMELLQSCTHPSLWSFWFIAKIIELLQLQIRSWILRGSGKL